MLEAMEQPVTIYRSADQNARDDAKAVVEMLKDEGIRATLVDDSAPGVPQGAWEVRVASADAPRAEVLVADEEDETEAEESHGIDESHDFDLVTVFETGSGTTEMDAQWIKNVLEANGIEAIIVGGTPIPSTGQELQVAREHADEARRVIAEAKAAGPTAADEGEAATEQ